MQELANNARTRHPHPQGEESEPLSGDALARLAAEHATGPARVQKRIAVVQQKGGVGKTSEVLGLISACTVREIPVLVGDVDPQANTTAALQIADPEFTLNDVMYDGSRGAAAGAIIKSGWGNVWVIPAEEELEHRERDTGLGFEKKLATSLDSDEVRSIAPLLLMDTRPSLGNLTINSLVAANAAIIIVEPSIDGNNGLEKTLKTIDVIKEGYNPSLEVIGIVVNGYDPRQTEARFRVGELEEFIKDSDALADDILWAPVPVRAAIKTARGAKRSIHSYGWKTKDVQDIYDSHLDRLLAAAGLTSQATNRNQLAR